MSLRTYFFKPPKTMLLIILLLTLTILTAFVLLKPISNNFVGFWLWRISYQGPCAKGQIKSADARISYTSYGDGLPIIFLHGGLGNSLDWFSQTPYFVNQGRKVILVDTRGHGDSSAGKVNYTYRNLAVDVVAVMDELSIAQSDFIGWSDGANIALLLADTYPERVSAMVLISANYEPGGLTPDAREDIKKDTLVSRIRRWISDSSDPTHVRRVHKLWLTRPQLKSSDLATINAPALIVAGDHDTISTEHTRSLATSLVNAELVILQKTGHAAPITRAEQVNQLISNFLAKSPANKN